MNSLLAPSNVSTRLFPCPQCSTSNPIDVVTSIDSMEELVSLFVGIHNRASCCSCGRRFEAPVRLSVRLRNREVPPHEYIPFEEIENTAVLESITRSKGRCHRVYSLDELERSIMAHVQISMHREAQRLSRRRESRRLARQHAIVTDSRGDGSWSAGRVPVLCRDCGCGS